MGTYYFYLIHTKREYFPVNCLGGPIKRNGIGRGLSGRAFALMLEEEKGRWVGDNVAVIGDDDRDDWLKVREDYADITANAILLVVAEGDCDEVLSQAESNKHVFMQLCHMVMTGQAPTFQEQFIARFGVNFAKRYKEFCKERSHWVPSDLAADGRR